MAILPLRPQQLLVALFCSLPLVLCQCTTTGQGPSPSERKANVRHTQRAIIVNYLNKGLPSRALKELRPLLASHPKDADLLSLMGLTQLALGAPAVAVEYLEKAHQLEPNPTTTLNLSSAYIESGDFDKASKVLIGLRRNKEGWASYAFPERLYHNMGLAAERRNRPKLALRHYRQALKHNPNFYLSILQIGSIFEKGGRHKTAQKYFRKALNVCPNCYDPLRSLAASLASEKRIKSATNLLVKYSKRRDVDAASRQKALTFAKLILKKHQ